MKPQCTLLAAALVLGLSSLAYAGDKDKPQQHPTPQHQTQPPTPPPAPQPPAPQTPITSQQPVTPPPATSPRPADPPPTGMNEDSYVHGETVRETAQQQGDFMQFDADKDGMLSQAELSGDADLTARFGALDTNSDGKLTRDEFGQGIGVPEVAQLQGDFKQLDDDKSGSLTKTEVSADADLTEDFDNLDDNNDGRLSQVEFNDSLLGDD